jgi:hypothetical protein
LQGSLPSAQIRCKATFEDPELVEVRRKAVQSKSVMELSKISSMSDFPVPEPVQRLLSRSKGDLRKAASRSGSKK